MALVRHALIAGTLGLSLLFGAGALADSPGDVYDPSGRLIESVEEGGVRVQYIYNAAGVLTEARYSDGRTVSYEPVPQSEAQPQPRPREAEAARLRRDR